MRFDSEGWNIDGQRTLRQNGALKKISDEMSNRARVPRRDHVSGGHLGSAAPTRTNTVTKPDYLVSLTLNTDGRPDPAGGAGPALWNQVEAEEGRDLLVRALMRRPSTYRLQAAIAAVHSEVSRPEETDWPQMVALYNTLRQAADSPVIELNRAVAMVEGFDRGLELVDVIGQSGSLDNYLYFHSARADLLRRLRRFPEAADAYRRALALSSNAADHRFLTGRLSECDVAGDDPEDPAAN